MSDLAPEVWILTREQQRELERQRLEHWRRIAFEEYGIDLAEAGRDPRVMMRLNRAFHLSVSTDPLVSLRERRFAAHALLEWPDRPEPDEVQAARSVTDESPRTGRKTTRDASDDPAGSGGK